MKRRTFVKSAVLAGLGGASVGSVKAQSQDVSASYVLELSSADTVVTFYGSRSFDLPQAFDKLTKGRDNNQTGEVKALPKSPYSSTQADKPQHVRTDNYELHINSSKEFDWFNVDRTYNYPQNNQQARISWDVYVPTQGEFVFPVLEIENLSSQPLRLDQDEGDIHDGIQLFSDAKIAQETRDPQSYRFYIPGEGVRNFANSGFPTFGGSHYITIFDNSNGVTYGLINGDTGPKMTVDDGGRKLDYMVGETTLSPGETIKYETVVGLHNGGSNAPELGRRLFNSTEDLNARRNTQAN